MPTIFFLHLGKFQPAKVGFFNRRKLGNIQPALTRKAGQPLRLQRPKGGLANLNRRFRIPSIGAGIGSGPSHSVALIGVVSGRRGAAAVDPNTVAAGDSRGSDDRPTTSQRQGFGSLICVASSRTYTHLPTAF